MKDVRHHTFESGHVTFDGKAKTYGVSMGNVVSGTQLSGYIRSHSQTECNGNTRDPGHLRNFDLHSFYSYPIDKRARQWCFDNKNKTVILYCIRHHIGKRRIIHGWLITGGYAQHEFEARFDFGRRKSQRVIDEAIEFLCGDHRPYGADLFCKTEAEVRSAYEPGPALRLALEVFRSRRNPLRTLTRRES